MASLTQIATATVTSQNIGAGLVQVFSSTLTGGANIEAIATLQISNRGGGASVGLRVKATLAGRLLADNAVEYIGTATASMEIQTLPFRWANGEALAISISSSDTADSVVNVTTIVDSSDGGSGGGATAEEVAEAVWDYDLDGAAVGGAGDVLSGLGDLFAKLFRWLGVLAGKSSDPATLAEIQATDGGATFDNAQRSLEALGDAVGAAQVGDWAITRTFQVSNGDKVSGVRMSLVGVAGKTDTTGSNGVATIKTDDGTFTLRVVVPAGYEDVADTTVVINGADSVATVTLVAVAVAQADPPLCSVTLPVVDQYGVRLAGVSVSFKFAGLQAGADPGAVIMSPPPALISDADGIVQANLIRLANYTATYKTADETRNIAVAVPNAGSYTVADA